MNIHSNWLKSFSKNIYSQYGEDGIIEKIFTIIPSYTKTCVEFGAWDGIHLSNTRNLIQNHGWSAILVEGNPEKFPELVANNKDYPLVKCVQRWITLDGNSTLDSVLAETPLSSDFDLLSIDIDGNDYHVWKSLVKFKPKLVVIEFLNTVPNDVEYIQAPDFKVNQGSSLLAFCRLAKQKGYELIAVTDFNAFFVQSDYYKLFEIQDNSPDVMNDNSKWLMRVFQTMDGTLVWRGNLTLLWKEMPLNPEKMQPLPKVFRFMADGTRSKFWKYLFLAYRWFYTRFR